jgi:hypothetical protein
MGTPSTFPVTPRPIPEGARLHSSVIARMALGYKPINLPAAYAVEP